MVLRNLAKLDLNLLHVFEAVYSEFTQQQWEDLPEYMRRGTVEKPEVLGMDGDGLRFAPIVFKPE